ncbi:Maf family protein [Planctobacterium marinum]|uniref:7-methyl-GTP pyrophosphatase n=1 Tax=Planctobacterium marinum TaxID=1631968 RepID=A0AA48HGT4_9ALTE|nr:Maf-like protein [Planctobacterium marinum]
MKQTKKAFDIQVTLASGSKYKNDVLSKLGIPFHSVSPNIDESTKSGESPETLVTRLAKAKAEKVLGQSEEQRETSPLRFVIGVDQVAVHKGEIIGKPGNIECAVQQLSNFSAEKVLFITGICLLSSNNQYETHVEPYEVSFKALSQRQIKQYIDAEMPLDCAGSFKCEGQGILLFSALSGRDPNALIGMPLIALQELFLRFDLDLFDYIQ